jgi:hypothetical protein
MFEFKKCTFLSLDCHGAKAPRNDGIEFTHELKTVIARSEATKQSRVEGLYHA